MKNKGGLTLGLLCLVMVGLMALSLIGLGNGQLLGVGNIRLGLDLRGGVTILYEADVPSPSAEDMNAANSLLRRRLDARGYTEATTGREGARQIRVNIPGVGDPEQAVREIGATARLTFRDEAGNILLTGAEVSRATTGIDGGPAGGGRLVVNLEFNSLGAQQFADATRANIGRTIRIYMDEELVSNPVVNETILGGQAQISGGPGGFTRQEADALASAIQQGSLPFGLTVVSMNNIGAQLGADALESSIIAGIIGIVLVIISMFAVYKVSGLAINIALMIYASLLLIIISAFQITLTLPGIAGIILSVGMAVDANVIIFERIREEIATGRTLRSAINAGFKRALATVLDCNITTLIAAGTLFWQGTGPIQGFALTLGLGIIISMFSALVLTRWLLVSLMKVGLRNPKWYGIMPAEEGSPDNPTGIITPKKLLPVVQFRRRYVMVSGLVLLLGLGSMVFHATQGNGLFNLDVEFAGGTSFQVDMGQPFNTEDVAAIVTEITGQPSPTVHNIIGEQQVMIRMHSIDAETRTALMQALSDRYNLGPEAFTYSDVSPTVSADMQRAAAWAVAVASVLMLIYITYRFRDVRMGVSTILVQLHDAGMTIAVFAILRIPLSYSFIAVLLTIIGYSINATIVIFDRVRENKARLRVDNAELVNISVTQTLRRSVIAAASTLAAVVAMFILGVPSIRDFTLPIIIGLIVGTYSSVFLAGSLWYTLSGGEKANADAPLKKKKPATA